MNELILQYYKIQVVGLIKLTQNVYKLKTNDGYYVAKCVEEMCIRDRDNLFDYLVDDGKGGKIKKDVSDVGVQNLKDAGVDVLVVLGLSLIHI